MTRHITYVSGTRADFGLMHRALAAIAAHQKLDLSIVVTGMHLDPRYGETWREVAGGGFDVIGRIPVELGVGHGFMAIAIADVIRELTGLFESNRPDAVLVLGDRGEMLGAAVAALHLGIPIVHIHGGERSGTIDEPVRHAISKLASIHLVATDESRERLVRMGEAPHNIHVVGAPGLDGLQEQASFDRSHLCNHAGLDPSRPVAVLLFHPVVQESTVAGKQVGAILEALEDCKVQVFALRPNADLGGEEIDAKLSQWASAGKIALRTHVSRPEFVSWLAQCDVLVGNSSAGIIEAASFGTPVVNVGSRQKLRQRNHNVVDVAPARDEIAASIAAALCHGRFDRTNIFGDGASAERIAGLLATLPLDDSLLAKINAY